MGANANAGYGITVDDDIWEYLGYTDCDYDE